MFKWSVFSDITADIDFPIPNFAFYSSSVNKSGKASETRGYKIPLISTLLVNYQQSFFFTIICDVTYE